MKRCLSLCLFLLAITQTQAQWTTNVATSLSDSATASLLTCGAGDEFYTAFGHTALRICDPSQNLDVVYNYGTFDFDEPLFYLKFARGKLNYRLARCSFERFLLDYAYERRSVYEQPLVATPDEVQRLYDALENNYKPENRYYQYDFFRDNCATRVRDMIEECIPILSHEPATIPHSNLSFRDLIYPYCEPDRLWGRLGVDILLGARCDLSVEERDYMFIPFHLRDAVDSLCRRDDGRQLASTTRQLLTEQRPTTRRGISPTMLFWILAAVVTLVTTGSFIRNHGLQRWKVFDTILFSLVAGVGLLLLFMWFCTDHYCTKWNLNLLWANPFLLWLAVRPQQRDTGITLFCATLLVVLLAFFWLLPQHFNADVFPVALVLLLRLAARLWSTQPTSQYKQRKTIKN